MLQIIFTYFIRMVNILEVIAKMSFSKIDKCSTLVPDYKRIRLSRASFQPDWSKTEFDSYPRHTGIHSYWQLICLNGLDKYGFAEIDQTWIVDQGNGRVRSKGLHLTGYLGGRIVRAWWGWIWIRSSRYWIATWHYWRRMLATLRKGKFLIFHCYLTFISFS